MDSVRLFNIRLYRSKRLEILSKFRYTDPVNLTNVITDCAPTEVQTWIPAEILTSVVFALRTSPVIFLIKFSKICKSQRPYLIRLALGFYALKIWQKSFL